MFDVRTALRERYCAPAWAFFEEVSNGTGSNHKRSADALAMSLWPSRGLELHGFEIKASRSDWVRERDAPEKAEEIASRCDRWWLVVADESIVKDGELPPTWGLLVPGPKNQLRQKVEASKLEAKPLSRSFLAAILRRAHGQMSEMVLKSSIADEIARKCAEREAQVVARIASNMSGNSPEKRIAKFEEASGVKIGDWDAGQIGEAVKAVLDLDFKRNLVQLEWAEKSARGAADQMAEAIKKARGE